MHDLVIRRGTVVDGLGGPPVEADVAVDDGRITEIGSFAEGGREEIDASGQIVTPGFVDVHTHYDGQATWDPLLTPSIWHGVTTVVMGNCGVGFAPAAPERREWLIGLMEGVEDIPGTALSEAMRWDWESMPEYLDALERFPRALDVGAQVAHGAVRAYVMDERGAANEAPTDEDISRMADIVRDSIAAGAVGFSTNRLPLHRAIDGREVPGTFAEENELFALGRAVRAGSPNAEAVFSLILPTAMAYDTGAWPREVDWMKRLSAETGLRFTFAFGGLENVPYIEEANAAGAHLVPQVGCRRQGLLIGLSTKHAFDGRPSYEAIRHLPLAEQARVMADPEVKSRILSEKQAPGWNKLSQLIFEQAEFIFPLGDPPNHEPLAETSLRATAERENRTIEDVLYDLTIEGDGTSLLHFMLGGYPNGNLENSFALLPRSDTVLGLGDGGAHVSVICDAGYPSFLLGYWARDRKRGATLPLETAVRILTREPAELYAMYDRGAVAVGHKADLNVLNPDTVNLMRPEVVHDLPAGASRIVQHAKGYKATVVSGEIVQFEGEDTGARPGRLVRGPQAVG